jgi:cob(I)alamin adenosyltransferase
MFFEVHGFKARNVCLGEFSSHPDFYMSIVTKTGDDGTTGIMYGHRVSKNDPRVEAGGTLDELNSALGLARAWATEPAMAAQLMKIQKRLVEVMGEVGVLPEDRARYVKDGFPLVTAEFTANLEEVIAEVEAQGVSFKGWATPGATPAAAALDLARSICRRAERRVFDLQAAGGLGNHEILLFLNRLSDLLWLFARRLETAKGDADKH